ncbi:thioredoxin-like protein [Mycena alexandri]|uniref:Thioredoxin-like protein n=1 Tax=Mycena alexandri TaxID=1745969 RepID=A0AAD6X647_9AGAR|nr:thioredoxin-like protein [Mycena alexandri]
MPMVSLWQKLLLLTCFALASASPVQTSSLEAPLVQSDFDSTIGAGVWFVEYYSYYCGHCRAFAPTWEKLVVSDPVADVQYARVDCFVSGALCDANGVTGYPQLHLYRDGQFVDKYKGSRGLDLLTEYLAQSVGAPTSVLDRLVYLEDFPTAPEPERPEQLHLQRTKFQSESTFELGRVTGGIGGPGSSGRIGGNGGDGEGPTINLDAEYEWKIRKISGGIGGPGGAGVEVGGNGGVGKGPVISISRRNTDVLL